MFPRISWSSLRRFEECPQKYYLARKGKEADIPIKIVGVGLATHSAVQSWVQGHTDRPCEYAEQDLWRRVDEATERGDFSVSEDQIEGLAAKASEYTRSITDIISTKMDRASTFAAEVHMNRYYQGWSLEGRIDLLERTPQNQLFLWDIKTGQTERYAPDSDQLIFYDVLARAVNVTLDCVGWIDRFGAFYPIDSDGSRRAKMRRRIKRAVEHIGAGHFPYMGFPERCVKCRCNSSCPALEPNREAARR